MTVVLAAACTRQSPTVATPPPAQSAAPQTTTTAQATATAHISTRCHTADLAVSLERAGAAAGTSYEWIVLKDSSGQRCTLYGYPGASLTNAAGAQLGQPAQRNPVYALHVVMLEPNQSAYARLGFPNPGNFPPGRCTANAAHLRVYPPDELRSLLTTTDHPYCPGFSVTAIVASRD